MKKIIVTGGLGFIGSYFIENALERGFYVINIDKKTYASRTDLNFNNKNYELIEEDILNIKAIPPDIDFIVNFAAETHVDNSIITSNDFLQTNIYGVYNLLELIRITSFHKKPKFIYISTDEVYGDINNGSFDENATIKASNPYSASKASAEQLVFAWGRTYGLDFNICRCCNNYGYGQNIEKLIPRTIDSILKGKKMLLHGDGTYRREWIYVGDFVEGIFTIVEKGLPGEAYNISSSEEYSNLEIAELVGKYIGITEKCYTFIENRPGQDKRYSLNWEKIRHLGWFPKTKLENYLPLYINKYKELGK